jgi:hypothetical protein
MSISPNNSLRLITAPETQGAEMLPPVLVKKRRNLKKERIAKYAAKLALQEMKKQK